jgi:hypothetical protein
METETPKPTPAPLPPKHVMDVAPPPEKSTAPGHVPVRPAPEGDPLTTPTTAEGDTSPLSPKPTHPQPKKPVGIIVGTILVMLALSTLAVVAYVQNRS